MSAHICGLLRGFNSPADQTHVLCIAGLTFTACCTPSTYNNIISLCWVVCHWQSGNLSVIWTALTGFLTHLFFVFNIDWTLNLQVIHKKIEIFTDSCRSRSNIGFYTWAHYTSVSPMSKNKSQYRDVIWHNLTNYVGNYNIIISLWPQSKFFSWLIIIWYHSMNI